MSLYDIHFNVCTYGWVPFDLKVAAIVHSNPAMPNSMVLNGSGSGTTLPNCAHDVIMNSDWTLLAAAVSLAF
jgi:hypothetical protein